MMNESQKRLILEWLRKIHKMEWAHRFESQRWKRLNLIIGIVALTLAATVAALPNIPSTDEYTKILVPILSAFVAILSALQTFLKPSEVSDRFRVKSDEFESLRHELEEAAEFHQEVSLKSNVEVSFLSDIRKKWSAISALNMSEKNFKKADVVVSKLNRYPSEYQLWSDKGILP